MDTKPETLTISLTDRPPVRINKEDWPIVASAKDYDSQVESQANRTWRLIVRQHDDGRAVVYGIHDTRFQNEHCKRGGVLVASGSDIASAVKRVGASLDFAEHLIQACISDLPAEEI